MAEHFVRPPLWEWYILAYFFFGGLSGGTYALATMLRFWGGPRDEPAARIGFLASFPLLALCPILLTLDLGQPLRFWHMLVDTTPGSPGVAFKSWSPMSVGSWALLAFGIFAFLSFLEALSLGRSARIEPGRESVPRSWAVGRLVNVLGTIFGLFVVGYTGVLLSVSNQPIWSDTWALGGLFVASGLSGSAALLAWLTGHRREAVVTEGRLLIADRYFAFLELVLIAIFFVNLAQAGTLSRVLGGPWLVLWLLVVMSLIPPLMNLGAPVVQVDSRSGSAAVARVAGVSRATIFASTLIGVLLMRFVVIFSAQF